MALILAVGDAGAMGGGSEGASGGDRSANAPSGYAEAEAAVKAGKYKEAIGLLEPLLRSQPTSADIHNYLGYSHRKLGDFAKAMTYYRKALELDDRHLGALEYLGELHLELNDLAAAENNLSRLSQLCPNGCEAYDDLKQAIDAYKAKPKS
jgi:tetratricopeptide (TPR) repeat protein